MVNTEKEDRARAELVKLAVDKCTCQCRKCKVAAERVEAVIRYLELNDKDLYGVKEND